MSIRPETIPNDARPQNKMLWRGLAWVLAAAVLALYVSTAAPNPWWGDGGELATAAKVLGIPHPTGYPLYMLTAHGAIKLMGWMEPGRATTLLNAFLLAAASAMTALLLMRALPTRTGAGFMSAAGLAAMIAVARTVWDHATITEVYPLTYFMCIAVLLVAWTKDGAQPGPWRAAALGVLMGLASLNHYSILALYPLTGLVVLEWTWGRSGRIQLGCIAATIGCWALMLSGYLYLPLRARVNPPINWGNPETMQNVLWVLRGGQFGTVNQLPGIWEGGVGSGTLRWLAFWGGQWHAGGSKWLAAALGIVILAPAIGGLIFLLRRRPGLGGGLLFSLIATLCFSIFYHIRDIEGYIMPALPAVAIGWMEAGRAMIERRAWRIPKWCAAAPLALAAVVAAGQYRSVDKSWDTAPTDYATAVLESVPQNAIVLTLGDNTIFSLWYGQIALGNRPDVTLVGTNFLNERWYQKYFEAAGRPKVPVKVADRGKMLPSQFQFELDLLRNVIIPCLKANQRVFVLYSNKGDFSVLAQFFSPSLVTDSLPPGSEYRKAIRPATALPEPFMWELHPNRALEAMTPEQVETELANFYSRNMRPVQRP